MNAVFKSSIGAMGRRTMMLALSLALVAAVAAIPTNKVLAAAVTGIAYTPSGATVATFVAASSTLTTFTPATAITAASTITLTVPAGSTLANIVAGDFTIEQATNGGAACVAGVATAPSGIAFDNSAKTITLTVAAASLSNTCTAPTDNGKGIVTIKTSGTAGGNEIKHPNTATTTGSFTVATSVGDSGSIANVTFVAGAAAAVFVETLANGTGSVYNPVNIYVTNTVTVYSISRDAQGNFVANVAATAWSLTSKTGGVVNGDLVAAGDSKSAVLTGNLVGSAIIHVTSGALTAGDSGTINVLRSGGGGGAGHSDTPVIIPATVDLTLPNGGNTLTGGSVVGISWSSSNGAFVKYRVSYSSDNGNTWTVLNDSVANTSYSWTVPTTSTAQGLIKVEGLDSTGTVLASDTSASVFAVAGTTVAPPPVAPPTPTTPPATDDTVEGTYDVDHARTNNPDFNTDMNLPAAPPFTAWCVSGTLIKSAVMPAVYYCGADGKRYVFVNDKAFFSWYKDFSSVQTVSEDTMAKITIGGNITYRPGTRMIKIQSDPKAYVVARGGILRWVATENAAKRLFGDNWNTMIDDVSDSFFVNYKIGTPISQ